MSDEMQNAPADALTGPTERPSPPSKDCGCGARPTSSHNRFCPEYTTEDHAWCLKQWSDARSDLPLSWIDALRFATQQKPALC